MLHLTLNLGLRSCVGTCVLRELTVAGAPPLAVRAEGAAAFFAAGCVCRPGAAAAGCCELSGSRKSAFSHED